MIDHNSIQFKNQINNINQDKLDKSEFKNVIKDYANLDKLEKFIHLV